TYTGQGWDAQRNDGWLAAFHPDDRARVRATWQAAMAERRVFETRARRERKAHDNHRRCVARAAPILHEGGQLREWVGDVIDVHDATLSQQRLQRQEAQIRAILHHSPAFIWVKDPSGRYLVASRQCQAVTGTACQELVGKTDYDVLPVAVADQL